MQINQKTDGNVTIFTLEGRFDAPSAPQAETTFLAALESGISRIVLDLEGVEYISSGGLRVVIMLWKALEENGGQMILCGLSPFVSEVFEITRLSQRLRICATRAQALQAIQA